MAKRLKFSKLFDYTHKRGRRGMTSYPVGFEGPVPDAQAEVALAGGYAEEVAEPKSTGSTTTGGAAGGVSSDKPGK